MNAKLVAPCGMNCAICSWHLGERKCPGCRTGSRSGIKQCARVFKCPTFKKNKYKFCIECAKFPCKSIKTLDERYRTRYGMSMTDNLKFIKSNGIAKFLKVQEKNYKCPECGGVVCVHNGKCYACDKVR
ncbi:MAG: DUF3795 domain-containing protein [Candidatus Aenigmatarchaeota archaeon]